MLETGIDMDISIIAMYGIIMGLGGSLLFKFLRVCYKDNKPRADEYLKASKIAFKGFKWCMLVVAILYLFKSFGIR